MQMIKRKKENEGCTFRPNVKRASSDFQLCRFDPEKVRVTSLNKISPHVTDTLDNKNVSQV